LELEIKHNPRFDTDKVCEIYGEKDGVDIKYVCTSDLRASDVPVDIFYRETPHPEFGNKYFGLYYDSYRDCMMITNADIIEEMDFGMIQDKDGVYHYSASHHDFNQLMESGDFIDGGRMYVRSSGNVHVFKIKDGEFVKDVLS